ncbi:MAG TPA: class I tRNA ligase family protein, partial [Geminicoccaceae bacterium]|nr:class I tRNA ligase family protein [Geminicoccaceae bacterium]
FEEWIPSLPPPGTPTPEELSPVASELKRAIHQTIHAVGQELERFHFNKAVALIRELSNRVEDFPADDPAAPALLREALETLVLLLGPMVPHLAEELWQRLGHDVLLADTPWPEADAAFLVEDRVTLAVQVNGKLRATISLPRGADRATIEAAALAEANVRRDMAGRQPRRVIVVPDRVVNVVV